MKYAMACMVMAACWTGAALAADGPVYSYGEVAFVADAELEVGAGIGSGSIDGDGFRVAGSALVAPAFFVRLGYASVDFDGDVEVEELALAGGWRTRIGEGPVDFIAGLGYDDLELSVGSISGDDDGFRLFAGLRGQVTERLELNGELALVEYDESDGTDVRVGGVVFLTDRLAVTFGYRLLSLEDSGVDLDIDALDAGLRLTF